MSLRNGTKLAHYEIVEPIGKGGMGDVYRAKDSKLGRDVAIKVLPDEFAENEERLTRFQREAKVLASLNHPGIAAIHGVEQADSTHYLVLELVPGETLAERIARGPIPVDESLVIAVKIAEALEEAHEQGIVHRDLKPANIKLTPDDKVKVLDFGLAKALIEESPEADSSMSPTITRDATRMGVILGTAAYMSPEQAKGKRVDRRTDIFAFGSVLYEMITGKKAFRGDGVSEVLAAVMKDEPDWSVLPGGSTQRVIRRCLSKAVAGRFQHIGDVRIDLQEPWSERMSGKEAANGQVSTRSEGARPWKLATLAACLLVLVLGWLNIRPTPPRPPVRFTIPIEAPSDVDFAVSPNGRVLAYTESGKLWIRPLDALDAASVPGTVSAAYPFWSPDSRHVGFFEHGKLKRVDLRDGLDGPVITLCDAAGAFGATWSDDGTIVFASGEGPLFRVDANGGEPVAASRLDAELEESGHLSPQFLPDGRRFLYVGTRSTAANTGIFVGSLDSIDTKHFVTDAGSNALYAPPGFLLFAREREGNWFAQPFDAATLELRGQPVVFAQDIAVYGSTMASGSVSTTGVVAYRNAELDGHIGWFDRSGLELGMVTTPGTYNRVHLSRDDAKAVVNVRTAAGAIEVLDLERGTVSGFPEEPYLQGHPILSPDGRRVVFAANPNGPEDLYMKASNGMGEAELIHGSPSPHKHPSDWSRDGRFVLFDSIAADGTFDLWILPASGDGDAFSLRTSPAQIGGGVFSPDGKWVAYTERESGRFEVYLQDFPEGNGRWQISTDGGSQVRWRADGKELFYLDLDSQLMALEFALDSGGEPTFGLPERLFQTRVRQNSRHHYDVTADGERFLMSVLSEGPSPIVVVLNGLPGVEPETLGN